MQLPEPDGAELFPKISTESVIFGTAIGGIVLPIAQDIIEFSIGKIFEDFLNDKTIKEGKQVITEKFGVRIDGYFNLDASGQYYSAALHQCMVVARGEYNGGGGIKGGFWSKIEEEDKKQMGLTQRPNFYAEFVPSISKDGSAFRLEPKSVIYPERVHAPKNRNFPSKKDAMSVSFELKSAASKTAFIGGVLFKGKSLGNLISPKKFIAKSNEFKPLYSGNELIPMFQPSGRTISKIGELRANWEFIKGFASEHTKRFAKHIRLEVSGAVCQHAH